MIKNYRRLKKAGYVHCFPHTKTYFIIAIVDRKTENFMRCLKISNPDDVFGSFKVYRYNTSFPKECLIGTKEEAVKIFKFIKSYIESRIYYKFLNEECVFGYRIRDYINKYEFRICKAHLKVIPLDSWA